MFIDARSIPNDTQIRTDVCIVGAGAAGITLARELIGQSFRVCLLESGGMGFEEETQSLYKGRSVGQDYFPLDAARLRYFGGSTNHWGGTCRPLDSIIFETRDWVPYSGWPFERTELIPYYERAQPVCELGPFVYDPSAWRIKDDKRRLPFTDKDRITTEMFQYGPPTRFGEVYREQLAQARNIDIYLHANVLDIETTESAKSVTRVLVSSLAQNHFRVSARLFVIACGGIENARILLLSNSVRSDGLGNDHGLVGRFFSDQIGNKPGSTTAAIVSSEFPWRSYRGHAIAETDLNGVTTSATITRFLTPSEKTLRHEKMLNCAAYLWWPSSTDVSSGIKSIRHLAQYIKKTEFPDDFWHHIGNVISEVDEVAATAFQKLTHKTLLQLHFWSEQCPNPESRIQLTNERDALGKQRISLDWRFCEMDRTNLIRFLSLISEELGRKGLGRVRIDPVLATEQWDSVVSGNYHHMGTTRMHVDPKQGVVDSNSRVHGMSNLYIAGSSTFPTTGHSNPTLTIVALTMRLADHIKTQLR